MSQLTFEVTGMVCSGCSETVQRVVDAVSGVSGSQVDHESGSAVVDHSGADAEAVYAAINDAGFGVRTTTNAACKCTNCRCDPCTCTADKQCNC